MNPRWLLAVRMSAHCTHCKWNILNCVYGCAVLERRKKLDAFSKEINFIFEFRMKETSFNGDLNVRKRCKGANTQQSRATNALDHRCCDKIEVFEMISSIVQFASIHTLLCGCVWCHFVIIFMPHNFFFVAVVLLQFETHCDHSSYSLDLVCLGRSIAWAPRH